MEVKPDFWIVEIDDKDYDRKLITNTVKFFDNFTEARVWLAETCKKRGQKLKSNQLSLYGKMGHYYLGHIVSRYIWCGYCHEYDTREYQLECDSLHEIGYPRNNGGNSGNLISCMSRDEKDWLFYYTIPSNKKNVYRYDYEHKRVHNILAGKLV